MMTPREYEAEIDRMAQEIHRLQQQERVQQLMLAKLDELENLIRTQPMDLRETIAQELDAYGAPQAARFVRAGGRRG